MPTPDAPPAELTIRADRALSLRLSPMAGDRTVRAWLSRQLSAQLGAMSWQDKIHICSAMVDAGIIDGEITIPAGEGGAPGLDFDIKQADAVLAEAARLMGFPAQHRVRIYDVAGYCPMGCGPHLHLMQTGVLRCLALDCPRPEAAGLILADRETEHVVEFTATSFTVRHPLRDRLGDDLFSCTIHTMCSALPGPPGGITGRYRARVHEGNLDLAFVTGPVTGMKFLEEPNVN